MTDDDRLYFSILQLPAKIKFAFVFLEKKWIVNWNICRFGGIVK